MDRVSQEFYCGECSGYFVVRLNIALNHEAEIVCPKCGHEHRRCIVNGEIYEQGRHSTNSKERVLTTMANYSKEPLTQKMRDAHAKKGYGGRRDGVPFERELMMEQWLNVAARERGEE